MRFSREACGNVLNASINFRTKLTPTVLFVVFGMEARLEIVALQEIVQVAIVVRIGAGFGPLVGAK